MRATPISLKEAQDFVDRHHRHHSHTVRDKYRIGAEEDGELIGIAQVGRPTSRFLDDGKTLEVTRLCVLDDHRNACSFLYSRCARVAKELGYDKIITYILSTEDGGSLRAAGWNLEDTDCGGTDWDHCVRGGERMMYQQMSLFPQKQKYPIGVKKQRYSRILREE